MRLLLAGTLESKDWIAILALIISVLSYLNSWQERLRSRREAVVKSLLGEKEAVAHMAYKISNKEWPSSATEEEARDEVVASLCFAWIFESSNRARALVLAALKEMNNKHGDIIKTVLNNIGRQFEDYAQLVKEEADKSSRDAEAVERGRKRLRRLKSAMGIEA